MFAGRSEYSNRASTSSDLTVHKIENIILSCRNFQLQSSLVFGMAIEYRIFELNKRNRKEEPALKHLVKDSNYKSITYLNK